MANSSVSRNALGAAYLRAVENRRRQKSRLFSDPLAQALLTPSYRGLFTISTIPGLDSLFLKRSQKTTPGIIGAILGRTRYIDEAMAAALSDGVEQIVILGAGLDSRAYRIDGVQKARVFEVDQQATIAYKQERLALILGELPEYVSFVPVDFDQPLCALQGDFSRTYMGCDGLIKC